MPATPPPSMMILCRVASGSEAVYSGSRSRLASVSLLPKATPFLSAGSRRVFAGPFGLRGIPTASMKVKRVAESRNVSKPSRRVVSKRMTLFCDRLSFCYFLQGTLSKTLRARIILYPTHSLCLLFKVRSVWSRFRDEFKKIHALRKVPSGACITTQYTMRMLVI